MKRKPVIAIAGLHGVGKTVYAKAVAERYGLRYVSAGVLFRKLAGERGMSLVEFSELAKHDDSIDKEIDRRTVEEAKVGGCVLDGLLVAWMAKDYADLKIWLKAPLKIRAGRVQNREGKTLEEALEETIARERAEAERFKAYYGIDLNDLSIYDLVIDTSKFSIEGVKRIIFAAVEEIFSTPSEGRSVKRPHPNS